MGYDYEIEYRLGKENIAIDTLLIQPYYSIVSPTFN